MSTKLLLTIVLCALASTSPADEVQVTAVLDNTMYQDSANSNGAGSYFFCGATAQGQKRRGLVQFDLRSIPPGSTINSARLILHLSRASAAGSSQQISVHRVTAAWGEGTSNANANEGQGVAARPGDATWNHRIFNSHVWAQQGGDFVASASATTLVGLNLIDYQWASTTLISDVQGWVNTPATNFGWCVRGNELGFATAKRFDAREGVAATRPRLIVNYTPPIPCPPDWNHSFTLDSQDYFDFMEDFFAGAADYNGLDGTESQDFYDFINDFSTGCGQP